MEKRSSGACFSPKDEDRLIAGMGNGGTEGFTLLANDSITKKIRMIQKKTNRKRRQKPEFKTPQKEFYRRIDKFCTCRLAMPKNK